MANDREELEELRRLDELEAKASGSGKQPRIAPGSKPLPSIADRLSQAGSNVLGGVMRGGPFSVLPELLKEGGRQQAEVLDRAAYETGGAVTDIASKAGLPAPAAAGLGFGTNVATQFLPSFLGGQIGSNVGTSMAKGLMRSALKPSSKAIRSGDAEKAVNTLLRERVNVTSGGAGKLRGLIDDLDDRVSSVIDGSRNVVDKSKAKAALQGVLDKFKKQVASSSDEAAIQSIWNEFDAKLSDLIPVQEAQAIKQGTYRVLAGKYGELGSASTEAQKAIARGLKESIEAAEPSVGPLNKRQSELINALKLAEYRAAIASNQNPLGLSWLASNPVAAAGFAFDRSQLLKSALANELYGARGTPAYLGRGMGALAGASTADPENRFLNGVLGQR